MTDPKPPEAAEPAVIDGTKAQREEARKRAQECMRELEAVLERYQCRVQPMVTSEAVGSGPGTRVLVGATWALLPEVVE